MRTNSFFEERARRRIERNRKLIFGRLIPGLAIIISIATAYWDIFGSSRRSIVATSILCLSAMLSVIYGDLGKDESGKS